MADDLSILPLPARRRMEAEPAKLTHARAATQRASCDLAGSDAA